MCLEVKISPLRNWEEERETYILGRCVVRRRLKISPLLEFHMAARTAGIQQSTNQDRSEHPTPSSRESNRRCMNECMKSVCTQIEYALE